MEAAVDEHPTFLSSQANLVLVQPNSFCWIQRTFLIELLCEESQFDVSPRGEMSFGVLFHACFYRLSKTKDHKPNSFS
jgi:hypothetical protein